MRKINQAGLDLLKSFERCKLTSYQDSGGIWTIGWGHVDHSIVQNTTWTQEQADSQLDRDLVKLECLDQYLSEAINDNQYTALVVLGYNIGLGALHSSTLLKVVNSGEDPSAEWMSWCHVSGVVSAGLIRRRQAELDLYHKLG